MKIISTISLCAVLQQAQSAAAEPHRGTATGFYSHMFNTFLIDRNEQRKKITLNNLQEIDVSSPVVFVVHGWVASSNESWVDRLALTFIERDNANVLAVDWTAAADQLYTVSVLCVSYVGQYVAGFIARLHQERNAPLSGFHIVGHSLGAHVAGAAAKTVRSIAGGRIARITALDPASPLFEGLSAQSPLTRDDADLVVAVHTDAGALGYSGAVGHVDFYPNGGGEIQPGCNVVDMSCSHRRSQELYAEALTNPDGFVSRLCASYLLYVFGLCGSNATATIGGDLTEAEPGSYFLRTNSRRPFSLEW